MPAFDNQNQTLDPINPSDDGRLTSGPLPFGKTEEKTESDLPVVDELKRSPMEGISTTSGIGGEEVQDLATETKITSPMDRLELKEPGFPPLPDIEEERGVPPLPTNLSEPILETKDKLGDDLGVKDVGMVPASSDGGDKPIPLVQKKRSKAPLIAGVVALLLLVIGGGVAVLNLDVFRGDVRQRAFSIYGEWIIGGYPEPQHIDQWDRCDLFENWCDKQYGGPVGYDSYCYCEPESTGAPGNIYCPAYGTFAGAREKIGTRTGAGNLCPKSSTPTPSAQCGDNLCQTGETCENGARRPDYSGSGDPGSWACLASDVGKAPSGGRVGECRFPGSPFGAPYCAQTAPTPTPIPTPAPLCVDVKAWVQDPGQGCLPVVGTASGCIAGDWKEIVPAQLTEAQRATILQVGNTIRFTVRGANATFTQARFTINGATPIVTTTKYGSDFYIDYQLTQSGPVSVTGELFK